jgi:hypothetical protein
MNPSYLFFVVSIACVVVTAWAIRRGRASRDWPSTPGAILRSAIFSSEGSHSVTIEFGYSVGGEEYRSQQIRYFGLPRTYRGLVELVERYPEGKEVVVYFDPEKPSRAVLEPGFVAWHGVACYCAVVFWLIVAVFGIYWFS